MILSPKFEEALAHATVVHSGQNRKGTDIPYIAHLMGVASIALEYGASEEVIAALLLDTSKDAGGMDSIEDMKSRFGEQVADIVDCCADTYKNAKPPWRFRKGAYIARIPQASDSVRLVSAADKLQNARAILRDYRKLREEVWGRFNGLKEGTLWYYRSLVTAFRSGGRNDLIEELAELLQFEKNQKTNKKAKFWRASVIS